MSISKLQLTDICYNAEFECYETKATIQDGAQVFVYPVHVTAPLTAEFSLISRALTERALRQHNAPDRGMHLHFPAALLDQVSQPHAA